MSFLPSLPLAVERVVERSDDRVSPPADISVNAYRRFTHPDCASLVDPLFCKQKRGLKG